MFDFMRRISRRKRVSPKELKPDAVFSIPAHDYYILREIKKHLACGKAAEVKPPVDGTGDAASHLHAIDLHCFYGMSITEIIIETGVYVQLKNPEIYKKD